VGKNAQQPEKETDMSAAFSTPGNRNRTILFLALCGVLAIAAVAVGIDDNPPGILLAFLAAIAIVLAFVHPWRTARKFMFLLLASALGFVLFAILNMILDSIAQNSTSSRAIQDLIESPVANALNIIIAMICPAGFIVGAVGSLAMIIRDRRRPT
jgi:hypothetical protein